MFSQVELLEIDSINSYIEKVSLPGNKADYF